VSREADVEALVAHALDEFGQLDCIFNNAGFGGIGGNLVDLELDDAYRNTIDVLFTGVLAGTKHAARAMRPRGGSIINTASVAGLRAGYGPHVYSAMKAAVLSLSRSAAIELGAQGIRVNAICPGFIATAIFAGARNWSYETRQRFIGELEKFPATMTSIRRVGVGADVAAMALYRQRRVDVRDRTTVRGRWRPVGRQPAGPVASEWDSGTGGSNRIRVVGDHFAARTICVQRNSAMVRPLVSFVTVASQTCVCLPR
jgi:NAD(P)-dependent dehydrogenase (short-subunit alcohol dehydrogenase family)